ncbi:hypothetical protein H0H93_014671 [Arthromyces matolae]|nr:hypothetical protein H0H93_014671 [Arthromyces matolae]
MNSRLATLTACIASDPSLMQHISILELHRFEYDISHDEDDDDPVVFSKKFTSLCSFLEQITCVKEIRLIRFDWTYIPSSLSSTLLELLSLPTISVLHLENFRSLSSEDFADLISTPPSLKHLTLVDLNRFRDPGTLDLPDAGKKEGAMLETLELSTFLDAQLLYGLFRPECTLNMSSLKKLTAINANLPLSLRQLVNIVGKSIEELVTNVTARNSRDCRTC